MFLSQAKRLLQYNLKYKQSKTTSMERTFSVVRSLLYVFLFLSFSLKMTLSFQAYEFNFPNIELCFWRRDYIKSAQLLGTAHCLRARCSEKLCTYHIRGGRFSYRLSSRISYTGSWRDQVPCKLFFVSSWEDVLSLSTFE